MSVTHVGNNGEIELEEGLWNETLKGLLLSWCWCLWVQRQVFTDPGPRQSRLVSLREIQ